MSWNNWVLIGIGAWAFLSPWILGFSGLNLVSWNSIMVGGLIIIFTLWNYNPEE